jgi:hypothetical protein
MNRFVHFLVLIVLFAYSSLFASEQISNTKILAKGFRGKEIAPSFIAEKILKSLPDKPCSVNFQTLDSLANAYSYFTESQQPFVYIPELGQLITIKRGFWDIDRYPGYTGDNTKNNLFIRYSTDWGQSWSDPILVYKVPVGTQFGNWWARYPSVFAFNYDGSPAYVYTAPATNGSGWVGFINGLYYQDNFFSSFSRSFTWKDGNRYNWGGTDSRIVGGMDGGEPFAMAVGTIMIEGGSPLTLTSHLGYRRTTDFDKWTEVIPPQWEASNFVVPSSPTGDDSLRTSTIAGFKFADDGNLYMAAYANFAAISSFNRFYFGVSKSTDLGKTWSSFDIAPTNLFDSYLQQYGLSVNNVFWQLPQFVPLGNDNYSFLVNINEDTTQTFRPYEQALHQLVEVYKQDGVWGVRKVADLSGYVLAYVAPTSTNQLGEESQLVRTDDGRVFVAKWVDFVDVIVGDTTYKRATNDIFVAVRRTKDNFWSSIKNITESFDYDRITWLPDRVPNSLTNIPILKLESIPLLGENETDARLRQRMLDTVPQYVKLGFFDVVDILGVDEPQANFDLTNIKVYPNPMDDYGFVEFYTEGSVNLRIEIYDLLGRKVKDVFNGLTSAGFQGVSFQTNNLPNGNYTLVISHNSQKIVKQITIMK